MIRRSGVRILCLWARHVTQSLCVNVWWWSEGPLAQMEISEDIGDEEAVASSSTTQSLTQEDNQDDPVSTASDDTMNQPISGPSSSPGESVEEHLEDPTGPTLDQKPTKEQVELLLLALKLKHGLTNTVEPWRTSCILSTLVLVLVGNWKILGPQIKEKCLFIKTVNKHVDIVFKFINHSEMLR
ncbi:uncharacterized protein LOC117594389 isoform X1 [Tachysurus ichikawai]